MANWKARTSSDAAGALGAEYQVFLNFRGYDTRHNFTDFLYDRLVDAGVHTFRDEEKLPQGDVISDRLERAINNSALYIPIFSPNYASSKWCLRELKLMVDNVSSSGGQKSILPIFLLVEPDDVKLKARPGSDAPYKTAFGELEKKFPDEVEGWKTALGKVDERKGWVVEKNTSQAAIIKSVIKRVLEKLEIKQKLVTENLVGLDDRVKDLTESLDVNHRDVRMTVIYGMGGIGKTTVAKEVFNQLSVHFGKRCTFLEEVRKSSSTKEGMVQLQKKLLSDIVDYGSAESIKDSEQGMVRIGETLPIEKVLVVLDDVHNKEDIKMLIGNSLLHPRSRIIITTRNTSILQIEGFKGEIQPYDMPKMENGHALQLFCRNAFGTNFPRDDFYGLSNEVVRCTGGLPLAIKVIGSLLKGEDEEFWKETLTKLGEVPEEEILEVLRISYDDLKDYQKQIFLDIACFLVNEKKTDAIYMWAGSRVYPTRAIKVLTERCLIKIDEDKFWMHDHLIDLGRQIVRENSLGDLGKQSRLWITKEALQIIRTEERKDEVEALNIDDSTEITNEEFEKLQHLRFLKLNGGTYAGDFVRCRSNLRWLSWHSPPEKDFRADNLYLDHLVVCKLDAIDFEDDSKAWDLIKRAQNLKVLSITRCSSIKKIPDISKCLSLERLIVADCSSLKIIESFIGDLPLLIELKIEECSDFIDLPEEVGALVKLKNFSLSGCKMLTSLPGSLGNLASLTELNLSDTGIRELPNSIGKLKSLRTLRFPINSFIDWENQDQQLPNGISTLVNLEELDLSGHKEIGGEIPIGIGKLSSLRILDLTSTRICRIPRTINMLHNLQTLNLLCCHKIQELPELPTSLTCLLLRSESLLSVPNLSNLTNLVELQLSDDSPSTGKSNLIKECNLRGIGQLSRLKKLSLCLPNIPAPPELASLSHLEELDLSYLDLKPLGQLPFSHWSWRNLSTLEFYQCEVEDIPLERFIQLEKFTIDGCRLLQRLYIPSELRKLEGMFVSQCPELIEIQVVGLPQSLESLTIENSLTVDDCKSLRRISRLSYLKRLVEFHITECNLLTHIEGLNELESLLSLVVTGCTSLRMWIDLTCTKIPYDCTVFIQNCGDLIQDSTRSDPDGISLERYKEEILRDPVNKKEDVESGFARSSAVVWRDLLVYSMDDTTGLFHGRHHENNDIERKVKATAMAMMMTMTMRMGKRAMMKKPKRRWRACGNKKL